MKVVICSPLLSYPGHFLRTTMLKALCFKNAGLDVTVVGFNEESGEDFRKNNLAYVSVTSLLSAGMRKVVEMACRHLGIARIVVVENFLVNRYAAKYARINRADIIFLADVEPWIIWFLALFGLMRRRDKIIGFVAHAFFDKSTAGLLPFFSYCRARLNHWLAPELPRLIDIICDNQFHVSRMFGAKSPRIHIIPEGYSYKETSKEEKQVARRRLGLSPEKKLLLFFGVANEGKGADLIYEALEGLEPDFVLLIVGTIASMFRPRGSRTGRGPGRWEDNIIRVPGFVSDEMRELYFAACDAVLLPHRRGYYTNTGSMLDAVNYGKAVIVADQYQVGYLAENYRLGLAFPPENIAAMRNCLREFAANPEEWFAKIEKNCKKLAQEYSWENVSVIYRRAFEKMMDADMG